MCRLPSSFLINIQSRVKQEVDMPEKNVTEIIL